MSFLETCLRRPRDRDKSTDLPVISLQDSIHLFQSRFREPGPFHIFIRDSHAEIKFFLFLRSNFQLVAVALHHFVLIDEVFHAGGSHIESSC